MAKIKDAEPEFLARTAAPNGQTPGQDDLRERAVRRLKRKREFRHHVEWFVVVNVVLWVIWAVPPDSANTHELWPAWVTGIWALILVLHARNVYGGWDEISEHDIEEEMARLRRG